MADSRNLNLPRLPGGRPEALAVWRHLPVSVTLPLLAVLWVVTDDPQWLPVLVLYASLALVRTTLRVGTPRQQSLAAAAAVFSTPFVIYPTILLLVVGVFRSFSYMPLLARGPLSLVVGVVLYVLAVFVDGLVRELLLPVREPT